MLYARSRTLSQIPVKVTRLIRTSYGDYDLNTIPAGMAIEVPVKTLDKQKKKGTLAAKNRAARRGAAKRVSGEKAEDRATVQWVRHVR